MSATIEMLTTGSTYLFQLEASKDGSTWDITGATVSLYLRKPSGTVLTRSATVSDGPNGVAGYTSLTTDLDTPGKWYRNWRVNVGGINIASAPFEEFLVIAPLG